MLRTAAEKIGADRFAALGQIDGAMGSAKARRNAPTHDEALQGLDIEERPRAGCGLEPILCAGPDDHP
jgi:hypothetical protein